MEVVEVQIGRVKPYEKNPRRNDDAVERVANSITEFGWQQPIVVDSKMVIIAGHTRLKAAQLLKLKKVPIHKATDLTPEQVKAYRIADNRLADLADWDWPLLTDEIRDLQAAGIDLTLLGWTETELTPMLEADWSPPDDDGSEPRDNDTGEVHTIHFSADAWETVERGMAKLREMADDSTISGQRAVELICADYLA